VVHWLGRVFDCDALFFTLNAFHKLLGVLVFTCHDVTNAKISKHDGCDRQQVLHLTTYERLVIANGITVSFTLHEEYVGNIQLPGLVLRAEFCALLENLLDCGVVRLVPVELGLHHKYRDVVV
jgi:hypothetical protein